MALHLLVGRAKHCTEEKRKLIQNLIKDGKTYKDVEKLVGCSATMIRNAIVFKNKDEKRGGKRILSETAIRNVIRCAKNRPTMSAVEICDELNLPCGVHTVRRRLREHKLYARSPRKVPLLKKNHVTRRLQFTREHVDWPIQKWRNILWTDESKIVLYGGKGSRQYVRRPPNTEYDPRYTIKTLKHGGSSIMIWGCFSYRGVGPIYKIDGMMDQHAYVNIMQNTMLPFAEEEMPLKWTFQQDNDPKHTSRVAKEWFRVNGIEVMAWPAQSPDLNPIENLWVDVKKAVWDAKPKNNTELWAVAQHAWQNIPLKRCQDLVDSMKRRCLAVIKNNGHATKY